MKDDEKIEHQEQPLTIFFVRHGQARRRSEDDFDPPLTPLGRQQANRISKLLAKKGFDRVYVSDLTRAVETAEAIMARQDGIPLTRTSELREVMSYNFLSGFDPTRQVERDIVAQERKVMKGFIEKLIKKHREGEKILIVAHGNLIRCLVSLLSGKNPKRSVVIDINNTGLTVLEVWLSGGSVLRVANSLEHLRIDQVT